jgi:hypothetical protein
MKGIEALHRHCGDRIAVQQYSRQCGHRYTKVIFAVTMMDEMIALQSREQRGNLDIENSRPASVRYVIDVAHVNEIAGIRPGCSFILYDLS